MFDTTTKLTTEEIQLLRKVGIDNSENLKEEITQILKTQQLGIQKQLKNQEQNPNIKKDWDISTLKIESERLVLKPVNIDYIEDIFREFTPEITKFMYPKSPEKIEETQEFVDWAVRENFAKTELHLAVFNKENKEFLGMTGFHNLKTNIPEIGIWFKKSAHGNKLGQEAANSLKQWADEHLNYKHLFYPVDQRNIGSRKVAESIGGILQNKPVENKKNTSGNDLEIVEYHIFNPNYQKAQTQDKKWIVDNLGWLDVKEVFRGSGFKAFADLCEPIIKNDWDISTLQIETERLILKPISLDYAEDIFRELTTEVAQNLLIQPTGNFEDTKDFTKKVLERMGNKKCLEMVILDKNQDFLGVCSLHGIHKKIIAPGIWLKVAARKQGFGAEAMLKIVEWAKEHLNFKQLDYSLVKGNSASTKIAKKIGGVFSKSYQKPNSKGKILDLDLYVISNPNYKPSNSRVQALVIKNAVDKFSRSDLDKIQELGRSFGLPGLAYIQYLENETKSPILKFLDEDKQREIQEFLTAEVGDLVLFVANIDKDLVHKAQNAIRKHVAQKLDLINQDSLKFVWIYDFPFFEETDDGKIDFAHNPFGIFQNWGGLTNMETLKLAKNENKLLELRAIQYDIACNGYEVLSGGKRNNSPECLMEGFKIVGYSEEEVGGKFGHMMEAYSYGAPTHAGFAWGLDRLFMVLTGEENIRETIAFPKNGSGIDLMTSSPSTVRESQLKELKVKCF